MEVQAWMVAIAVIFVIVGIFTPIPVNIGSAVRWWIRSAAFLVLAKDTAKPKTAPAPLKVSRNKKVRVIFIRHGDSVWNSLFNRFGFGWPFRAIRYGFEMIYTVLGNRHDSVIIDSPLSRKGEQQAADLERYVKSALGNAIPTDAKTTVVVSSNLRRAMATALIGLDPRLRANGEKILIDSALQEGSRNADAQSFMLHRGRLADSPVLGYHTAAELGKVFDPTNNLGNKKRNGANVFKRIDAFAARIFGEGPDGLQTLGGGNATTVIAVGHSLWFKNFFGRYLPESSSHVAKKKKMKNCAVVAFDLLVDEKGEIRIDEASINPLYLGFSA